MNRWYVSNHYYWLTSEATKMLHREILLTRSMDK